jgi:hypothetical protein
MYVCKYVQLLSGILILVFSPCLFAASNLSLVCLAVRASGVLRGAWLPKTRRSGQRA